MSSVKLSVIIPSYNAASTLGHRLEALAGQQWSESWDVIVADNRATDGTRALVEHYCLQMPNLCLVDASDQRGAAYARNAGARAAQGECLAFIDADDEAAPSWVAAKRLYRQALAWDEWNVFIYERYRPQGMPKLSRRAGLQGWWKLLRTTLWLRWRQDFSDWFWQFAWRLGRVRGSLKYRVWAL